MHIKACFSFLLLSTLVSLKDAARESIDGGFGANIRWYTDLDAAIRVAQAELKPIMLVVHRSWCPACKKLKPELRNSQEFVDLSDYFVMVNLDDETSGEAQTAALYAPDGAYVPRIVFLDWLGNLRPEFYNKWGSKKYKYYHSEAESVTSTMKSVLDYFVPIANDYRHHYVPYPYNNFAADL